MVLIEDTLNGQKYRDEILETVSIPFGWEGIGPGFIFQDDHATPHRNTYVNAFHEGRTDCTHMEWPSKSPNINPIEQLWDQLEGAISRRSIRNLKDLAPAAMEEWSAIPHTRVRRPIRSIRSRCEQVIAASGGAT